MCAHYNWYFVSLRKWKLQFSWRLAKMLSHQVLNICFPSNVEFINSSSFCDVFFFGEKYIFQIIYEVDHFWEPFFSSPANFSSARFKAHYEAEQTDRWLFAQTWRRRRDFWDEAERRHRSSSECGSDRQTIHHWPRNSSFNYRV